MDNKQYTLLCSPCLFAPHSPCQLENLSLLFRVFTALTQLAARAVVAKVESRMTNNSINTPHKKKKRKRSLPACFSPWLWISNCPRQHPSQSCFPAGSYSCSCPPDRSPWLCDRHRRKERATVDTTDHSLRLITIETRLLRRSIALHQRSRRGKAD